MIRSGGDSQLPLLTANNATSIVPNEDPSNLAVVENTDAT